MRCDAGEASINVDWRLWRMSAYDPCIIVIIEAGLRIYGETVGELRISVFSRICFEGFTLRSEQ